MVTKKLEIKLHENWKKYLNIFITYIIPNYAFSSKKCRGHPTKQIQSKEEIQENKCKLMHVQRKLPSTLNKAIQISI